MSNVTRADIRQFLSQMDALAEPDAAARLHQAQMLAACAAPDDLVRIIARIAAQGRVTMENLNVIAGMGYTLPPRPAPDAQTRAEVIDSLVRGLPDLPSGVGGGIHVHLDDIADALRRAYTLGRMT